MKSIVFLVLILFWDMAIACKCDMELTKDKVMRSSNVMHIKVNSLKLGEFKVNNLSIDLEGVEVDYEVIENLWGPDRHPRIVDLFDSCRVVPYPGDELIVVVSRNPRFGINGAMSRCDGSSRLNQKNNEFLINKIRSYVGAP